MSTSVCLRAIGVLVPLGVGVGVAARADAQTLIERSVEVRFQLDLQVPDAALTTFLPSGWTLNVATQGAAKDANLRAIFVDRLTIHGADGRPIGKGSNRFVYLAVPARDPTGASVQLVIGGLTEDPADSPGPFGVYLPATTHTMRRETTRGPDAIVEAQDWVFAAPTGERLEMHIVYQRGVGNRSDARDVRFSSARDPSVVQIWRQEQILEILRNVTTTPPDRVRQFSFTAGGGRYAKLFDGTEKVLSWDDIPWLNRSVFAP